MSDIKILIDDKTIVQVRRLHIEKNVGLEADVFEFEIDNSRDAYTDLFYGTSGQKVEIEIQGILTFRGLCDSCNFSYFPEQIISVQGRDYTGFLIDEVVGKKLAAKFSGKTASQIIKIIAQNYGYTAEVSNTSNIFNEEKLYSRGESIWSIVKYLAKQEGFDAWVTKEKIIKFKARSIKTDIKRIFALNKKFGNIPSQLEFTQDKTLSLALKVEVIGYNPKAKERISFTAESPLRNRPNYKVITIEDFTLKTKEEVKAQAEAQLKEFSKDLTIGSLIIPLDSEIEPSDCIRIKNLKMAGDYFVTDVIHDYPMPNTTTLNFASKILPEDEIITKESTPFTFP